ncbi:MAG: hypothetical protein LBP51_01580 [Deferribacteraceae bacterium]|jgi:hypothetical protein|nr:hypothetical protein [Deferribacteraceae bacterium]
MRKITLALLSVFAVFVWACDDGMDEKASLGTVQVIASPSGNPAGVYDLYTSTGTSPACVIAVNQTNLVQQVRFDVFKNPSYNGTLSRVVIIQTERKITPVTAGAPVISVYKSDTITSLYPTDFSDATISYNADLPIHLLSGNQIDAIFNAFYGGPNLTLDYIVDYKFTLKEVDTGIEDEVYVEGLPISFGHVVSEGECVP